MWTRFPFSLVWVRWGVRKWDGWEYMGLTRILCLRGASRETFRILDILAEECDMLLLCRRGSHNTSTMKYLGRRLSRYRTMVLT